MGIRATCPNGHELHLKAFLAGKKGICPKCGAKFRIPDTVDDDSDLEPATTARAPAATRPVLRSTAAGAFEEPIDDLLHGQASAEAMLTSTRVEKPVPKPTATRVVPPKQAAQPAAAVLAESPDAAWYVQLPSGERFGPALAPEMQAWLGQGRVPVNALVWRQGWPDWRTASTVFIGLPATAPAAAPGATVIATDESVPLSTASVRRRMARRFERSLTSVIVLAVVVVALAAVLVAVVIRGG